MTDSISYWILLHMIYLVDAIMLAFLVSLIATIMRSIYENLRNGMQNISMGR